MGNDLYSRRSGNNRIDVYDTMDGISIDGRLIGIMSNKDYEDIWSRECWDNSDPTRQYMFGVNLIIFSLTQEGGITHRLMASVQY